jgi:hypothetical protein
VFESRVLKRIFVPEGEKVAGGWKEIYNEGLHYLCVSQTAFMMIKTRRMR